MSNKLIINSISSCVCMWLCVCMCMSDWVSEWVSEAERRTQFFSTNKHNETSTIRIIKIFESICKGLFLYAYVYVCSKSQQTCTESLWHTSGLYVTRKPTNLYIFARYYQAFFFFYTDRYPKTTSMLTELTLGVLSIISFPVFP